MASRTVKTVTTIEPALSSKDHDLLIKIDTNLSSLMADFKDFKHVTDINVSALDTRIRTLEETRNEWIWFKGVGKFVWGGFIAGLSILAELILRFYFPAGASH